MKELNTFRKYLTEGKFKYEVVSSTTSPEGLVIQAIVKDLEKGTTLTTKDKDILRVIDTKDLEKYDQFNISSKSLNEYDSQLERGQDYEVHEPGMDEWHDLEYIGFDRNEDEHIFMDTVNISPGSNEIYIMKIPNGELMDSVRGLDSQPHESEAFDDKFKGTTPDDIDF